MKTYTFLKNSLSVIFFSLLVFACEENGIDDITPVDPGPDQGPPVVSLEYPSEGTRIQVAEDITDIDIRFEVTDDIEVDMIRIILDGNEIAVMNDFPDYRIVIETFNYAGLGNGEHTLTIEATDLAGNVTTQTVNFEKLEPYQTMFDGEIFYMPFDGDFTELVTITPADQNGTPGFAGMSITGEAGTNAYQGATDSYLSVPTSVFFDEENLPTEFSATFWYQLITPPNRASVLVIGPPNEGFPDSSVAGFRLFREGGADSQNFQVNVGNGTGNSGLGPQFSLAANTGEWVHIAFSISESELNVYLNDQLVENRSIEPISWAETESLSIMSGTPNFVHWNHLSDASIMDELRLYDKALSQSEVETIIDETS